MSPRKRRVYLAWREPALEVANVLAIEDGASDLQQRRLPRLSADAWAYPRPRSLLKSFEATTGIQRRPSACGRVLM